MEFDAMRAMTTGELPESLREPSPEQQRPGAQLAAVTQSYPQPEAEQAEQDASEPETLVTRALMGGRKILDEVQRAFDPTKNLEAMGEGAVRNFAMFEGMREPAGLGVAEAFQGVNHLTLMALEKFGLANPGDADRFKNLTEDQRETVSRAIEQKFGTDTLARITTGLGRGVGRAVPAAMVGGAAAEALPVGGSIGASAVRLGAPPIAGAIEGATEFASDINERAFNTMMGLGAGSLGSLFEVGPFIRERGRRFLSGVLDKESPGLGTARRSSSGAMTPSELYSQATKRRMEIIDEGVALQERTGVKLKTDQIDPDVHTEAIVRIASQDPGVETILRNIADKQPQQLRAYLDETIDALGQGGKGRFGTRVAGAFKRILGDAERGTGLLGKRAAQANADFAAVTKATGGAEAIPLNNYLGELDRLIAQSGKRGATTKQIALANEAREMVDRITKAGSDNAVVGANDLQNLLAEFGAATRESSKVFQKIEQSAQRHETRTLFAALKRDLDEAIDAGVPGSAELKAARDNYRDASTAIEALDDSVIGKLFGGSKTRPPESVEKAFLEMDADTMRSTMGVLERADPDLQKGLQAYWLENAMEQSSRGGPVTAGVRGTSAEPEVIPAKFLELRDRSKNKQFEAVFTDPETRKRVNDALLISSRIATNNARTGGKNATKLKDLAGIMASGDNTFIARLGAEMLAPKFLAHIVTGDAEVIRALHTFTTPYNGVTWATALSAISNHLREQGVRNPEEVSPEQGTGFDGLKISP